MSISYQKKNTRNRFSCINVQPWTIEAKMTESAKYRGKSNFGTSSVDLATGILKLENCYIFFNHSDEQMYSQTASYQ